MTHLLFVDTETTGLDPSLHDTIEVAWVREGGVAEQLTFVHTLRNAEPKALEVNRYHERDFRSFCSDGMNEVLRRPRGHKYHRLIQDLTGATLVGENIGFDIAFLRAKLGFAPWHYRPIELSTMAMLAFNIARPPSLTETVKRLSDAGIDVPDNDHSAVGDALTVRGVYQIFMGAPFQMLNHG